MSEVEDIAGTGFDELLQQVHLDDLDVVDLHINERLDKSEETVGHRLESSGWYVKYIRDPWFPWEVSRTVFRSWMLPLMDVVITLIDQVNQLFNSIERDRIT